MNTNVATKKLDNLKAYISSSTNEYTISNLPSRYLCGEACHPKLDKAKDVVEQSGNDKAEALLEKAIEAHEKAEKSFTDGDIRKASKELRIARILVKKAVKIASR